MIRKALSFCVAVFLLGACSSSKKTTNTAANTTPSTTTTSPSTAELPANGVYPPRQQELAAIQGRYKDATVQQLNEGHSLYIGVCANCHKPKNIYSRSEENWPGIIDNMAKKAKITDEQKDAVLKYVLAIKAARPQ